LSLQVIVPSPSVISCATAFRKILGLMNYLGPHGDRRTPRFRLTDSTQAFLQFHDGQRTSGELHVISFNGGLLALPEPVHPGSVVELTFQTHRGAVLGTAEMLTPISGTQQPFRFVTLPESDQRTLQSAFQSGLYRNTDEEEMIEELRAVVANWNPYPLRQRFGIKLVIGLIALVACLLCIHYIHPFPR